MPIEYEGELASADGRYAIVVSRYNESITRRLLSGAVETLCAVGVADESIDVAWTPGTFEIPLAADRMAESGRYRAVICLGAVIRGETSHDQHINRAVSLGLIELALRHSLPITFGILTCDSMEQAINRAGGGMGNKGTEAAEAALRMASLIDSLPIE